MKGIVPAPEASTGPAAQKENAMKYKDLKAFCAKDFSRASIMVPILVGDWLYATDGHICIRAKGIELPEGFGTGPVDGFDSWPEPSQSVLDGLTRFFQEEPRGLKRILSFPKLNPRIECKVREGHGAFPCEACDHENDCPGCWGEGYNQEEIRLDLGGVFMSGNLLGRILHFPELEIELRPWDRLKGQRFRFNGGEGIIMPLKQDLETEYLKLDLFAPEASAAKPAEASDAEPSP